MPINILMPALSPTMEKGNLAKWLKKEGDPVKAGDIIAEIETDKATMEVKAAAAGAKSAAPPPAPAAPKPPQAAEAPPKPSSAPAPSPQPSPQRGEGASAAPPPPSFTSPRGGEVGTRSVPGEGGRTDAGRMDGGRIFSSPLARRLAREAGIDLGRVQGTGPHGRVVARDIEAAKSGTGLRPPGLAAPAAAAAAAAPMAVRAPSDEKIRALFEPGSYEVVPHDNMRKIIAQRLTESKLTIPHFYLTIDCTLDRLLAAREEINATAPKHDGKPAYKISVNDFVIKALALALQKVPEANVTWTEGAKLMPEEYQGGSTAVSNLGMYGIKDFYAVINPPHATILSVGAGEARPLVRDGKIEIAQVMTVGLSTDHRAVDGALGAELLGAFRQFIENPVMMLV